MLAAATAAVFVCAPAGAIQITSSSPSGDYYNPVHVFEDMNNMFEITTDVDFESVEWKLMQWSSSFLERKNDPGTEDGTDTNSYYSPALGGMGETSGSRRYIRVTAYDANGGSDSETIWLLVWKRSVVPNQITYIGANRDHVAVGESFEVKAETLTLYSRVEWHIKNLVWFEQPEDERIYGEPIHVTTGMDRKAVFTHAFESDVNDRARRMGDGRQYYIIARAFSFLDPDAEPVEAKTPIRVHEGKKKFLHTRVGDDGRLRHEVYMGIHWMDISSADIDGDGDEDEWECAVYWDHSITYYNETPGDKGHVYAYVKLFEVWNGNEWEISTEFTADEAGDRNEPHLLWNLDIAYKTTVSTWMYRTMRSDWDTSRPAELVPGRRYYLYGETRLVNADIDILDQNPKINKKHWKPLSNAVTKTETREFDPRETPGEFWVEGHNGTPSESEEEEEAE